jgi:hypothetical protein
MFRRCKKSRVAFVLKFEESQRGCQVKVKGEYRIIEA